MNPPTENHGILTKGENMFKILIVEDDQIIADGLKQHLEKWDYNCRTVHNFKDIMEEFNEFAPDLVCMDIVLPYYNGFYWCNQIREISRVPLIFISSANDKMSLVMAIQMGGDDFITKPFDLDIVTAKLQAILRRTYDFKNELNQLKVSDVTLDLNEMVLSYNNQSVELTKNEFKILQTLMLQPSTVISRTTLIEKCWESDEYIDDNTLTVNINRLRKLCEQLGLENFIRTKKGLGYAVWKD